MPTASCWRLAANGLLAPLVLIAAWQAAVSTGVLRLQFLPTPAAIAVELTGLAASGELAADLAHTVGVVTLAVLIAIGAGSGLGLAIGLLPMLRVHLASTIDVLRTIPAVALVPVALLTFGPVPTTELMLAVFAATWPVLVNTAGAVADVPGRLRDVAATLRLSRASTVCKIVIPAVVPAVLVGARLAVIIGLHVCVIAEMLMYPRGLGGGLIESMNALHPARLWAYAVSCGVVGYLLSVLLQRAVRLGLPGSTTNVAQSGAP